MTVFQNYCFLYLHLNILVISKSKSCSWWIQLAGKHNPYFSEKCCFLWLCSTLINDRGIFLIFGIHFHVQLCKVIFKYHGSYTGIHITIIQGAAERSPLFWKLINSKPKKIWQMFFYFWKVHRMPFYINVFWTKHRSSGGLEYWYTDVASLGSYPWPWESFQV